jgi:hypothetical protein
MVALPSKADLCDANRHVWYGPMADISYQYVVDDPAISNLFQRIGILPFWTVEPSPPIYKNTMRIGGNRWETAMKSRRPIRSPERLRFAQCGFTDRTAAVLIRAGIGAPEHLLHVASDRIRLIQGIGPGLMKEIERYQRQNLEAARRTETTP